MKDTHFLYSIATLAIGSIIAIFVSYTTGSLPKPTPRGAAPSTVTTPAAKKCGCCAEITPQELKARRQQNEALRKKWQAYIKATELLKKYGLQEGLRRIKQSNPEIAAQLENFTQKNSVDPPEH